MNQMQAGQIKIVEYNEKYISHEEIKEIAFDNYANFQNSNEFNGVYLSMKLRYGNFTYLIFLSSLFLFSLFAFMVLSKSTEWPTSWIFLLSVLFSIISSYLIFGVYLVKKIRNLHINYGHQVVFKDFDINEKFFKKGGVFLLAVLEAPNGKDFKVLGHCGIIPRSKYSEKDSPKNIKAAYFQLLGVVKEARGIGLGRKLLEHAIEFARNKKYNRLTLSVLHINTIGINLYKKYEFRVKETFLVDPLTGFTAYDMVKVLD